MQPGKLKTPSDPSDAVYALLILIIVVFIIAMLSGCVSIEHKGIEPVWKPHVYLYSPRADGGCAFVDGEGHTIDCDEPLIHDYFLAPLEDLVSLKAKLSKVRSWE